MYFHVIIETSEVLEPGRYREYFEFDRQELETVERDVIEPYLREERFQFDGYFISPEDIKRIVVKSTERTTSDLAEHENSKPRPRGLIVFTSRPDLTTP